MVDQVVGAFLILNLRSPGCGRAVAPINEAEHTRTKVALGRPKSVTLISPMTFRRTMTANVRASNNTSRCPPRNRSEIVLPP